LRGATWRRLLTFDGDGISIHAPLARRDAVEARARLFYCISIHAPLARRDRIAIVGRFLRFISIHAPLARRDGPRYGPTQRRADFNPRASCEARPEAEQSLGSNTDISIHAPLARRDPRPYRSPATSAISIHAPLARRDMPFFWI